MKIRSARIFALKIPFTEAFKHSAHSRAVSDSIVLRLEGEDGTVGYGETLVRPYVTGETVESCVDTMSQRIWPKLRLANLSPGDPTQNPERFLDEIGALLPDESDPSVLSRNGAICAFELALIDLHLKSMKLPLSVLLPPKRTTVVYSGVISSSSNETSLRVARHFKLFGLKQLKIKIGDDQERARVEAIRALMGPDASIRVDANSAYSPNEAAERLNCLADLGIVSAEQPIPRGEIAMLAELKSRSKIPIMVDESLITFDDAKALIENNACDFFNLRIAKCGGLRGTMRIARLGTANGIRLQLGCLVGETAILSAAGRALAAHLDGLEFVEGSFGEMLLMEDVAKESVAFGHGGKAPLLKAPGLGITVKDQALEKHADRRLSLET